MLLFTGASLKAQTIAQMDTLEARYQVCLDHGSNMLDCSVNYFFTMDSVLNAFYKKIMSNLDPVKKHQLRTEQRNWLKETNTKFKQIEKEVKAENPEGGEDPEMFIYDKKAKIINERIREFIRAFHSIL